MPHPSAIFLDRGPISDTLSHGEIRYLGFWFKHSNQHTYILFCLTDTLCDIGRDLDGHSSREICLDHLNKRCQLSE